MAVLVFFAWLGVCALVSWLTAFRMPDGYGNIIFLAQFFGAGISAGFLAMGLPTAIDPSTKVVVSGPGGGPNRYTTWPRRKGVKLAVIGGVVFVVSNLGGYILDRAWGLPTRHTLDVQRRAESWVEDRRPALDLCLTTVWTPRAETCRLRYRVTTSGGAARLALRKATCASAPIAACVERHLDDGTVTVERRQLDSLVYAGAIEIDVELPAVRGSGPPPPAERGE